MLHENSISKLIQPKFPAPPGKKTRGCFVSKLVAIFFGALLGMVFFQVTQKELSQKTHKNISYVVGAFKPVEKYACQIGSFPQVGVKINNTLKPPPNFSEVTPPSINKYDQVAFFERQKIITSVFLRNLQVNSSRNPIESNHHLRSGLSSSSWLQFSVHEFQKNPMVWYSQMSVFTIIYAPKWS